MKRGEQDKERSKSAPDLESQRYEQPRFEAEVDSDL
jgi:hypothetical protein